MTGARVALVHERFTEYAGSERVVAELALLFPNASILAPIAVPGVMPAPLDARISAGPLSRFTGRSGRYAHLLPLLPSAVRRLPVGDVDVVIASHHAFASQVVHATSAPVVAYVHSPARWVWDPELRAGESGGAAGALALSAFAAAFRSPDRAAAARLRTIVANSTAVAERVHQWWGQPSVVVPPPVDTQRYTPDPAVPREDFFLLAGRLVPYKMPQLAVRAARLAGVRLVVAGDGRARAACEQEAGPLTTFLGRVSDDALRDLYRRCSALLMPGIEDFGIVPVEAQACGAPVLAVAGGGALDTVIPGVSGELVRAAGLPEDDAAELWAQALQAFRPSDFSAQELRSHAEQYSHAHFRRRMQSVVSSVLG